MCTDLEHLRAELGGAVGDDDACSLQSPDLVDSSAYVFECVR
jgi:hypothetical protein